MKTIITINQLAPQANKPQFNFKTMQQTVAKNAAEGSQLSIFPEDFLYGVLRDHSEIVIAGKSFGRWVKKFCELAKQYQIDIIPGTFPSLKDNNTYNSTVYIDKTGKVITTYLKNNLWLSERDEYRPSLQPPTVFNSVLGKTAIIICWDILDHKLFQSSVKQGAKWVVVLSFWSTNQSNDSALERGIVKRRYPGCSDTKIIDVLIQSRVIEYNVGLIFCNFAGKHDYQGLYGLNTAISANRSQVIYPFLIVNKRLSNRKEATLTCEIDDITRSITDFEIHYGRREDVVNNYPWGQP
jgi:predicted amidohydrolase